MIAKEVVRLATLAFFAVNCRFTAKVAKRNDAPAAPAPPGRELWDGPRAQTRILTLLHFVQLLVDDHRHQHQKKNP